MPRRGSGPGERLSRGFQLGLGLVISLACLWLAMHDVRPAEVWEALSQANYAPASPC